MREGRHLDGNEAQVVRELARKREPLAIAQNDEAKRVIQDAASREQTRETMALLKIVADHPTVLAEALS